MQVTRLPRGSASFLAGARGSPGARAGSFRPFSETLGSRVRGPRTASTRCEAGHDCARRGLVSRSLILAVGAHQIVSASIAAAAECEDFKTAPSGIQYCDVREGTGKEPAKGSLIRCHYRGRLASNNAVFDSSYERGRPLTFKVGVGEVIKGWDQGIAGAEGIPPMKEGGKRVLVIPSELGYGKRGAGGVIPPNANLRFDVELLGKK